MRHSLRPGNQLGTFNIPWPRAAGQEEGRAPGSVSHVPLKTWLSRWSSRPTGSPPWTEASLGAPRALQPLVPVALPPLGQHRMRQGLLHSQVTPGDQPPAASAAGCQGPPAPRGRQTPGRVVLRPSSGLSTALGASLRALRTISEAWTGRAHQRPPRLSPTPEGSAPVSKEGFPPPTRINRGWKPSARNQTSSLPDPSLAGPPAFWLICPAACRCHKLAWPKVSKCLSPRLSTHISSLSPSWWLHLQNRPESAPSACPPPQPGPNHTSPPSNACGPLLRPHLQSALHTPQPDHVSSHPPLLHTLRGHPPGKARPCQALMTS